MKNNVKNYNEFITESNSFDSFKKSVQADTIKLARSAYYAHMFDRDVDPEDYWINWFKTDDFKEMLGMYWMNRTSSMAAAKSIIMSHG